MLLGMRKAALLVALDNASVRQRRHVIENGSANDRVDRARPQLLMARRPDCQRCQR